jgi:hypothetical protein
MHIKRYNLLSIFIHFSFDQYQQTDSDTENHQSLWCKTHYNITDKYRIIAILKVETDIIANISASPIGRAGIFVIMYVKAFKTDVIVFICDVIMCFTSDWPINLRMRVTKWPNIFVEQGQLHDPDFISGTHQKENLQFANKTITSVLKVLMYINHSFSF